MLPTPFLTALHIIVDRLQNAPADWVVTGSLGMALQGVPLEPHDIDLQTDEPGAYVLEERLREYVVRPVVFRPSERIRSHFGALMIEGLKVEIMGDVEKLLPGESAWIRPPDMQQVRRWVELDGLTIPVMDLEYEVRAYRDYGRLERAEMLQAWLAINGNING
jgi:hypothetical protein